MGIYVNEEIINNKIKDKETELEKANVFFELAFKEAKIRELEKQNAVIMLELAKIKGGMKDVV